MKMKKVVNWNTKKTITNENLLHIQREIINRLIDYCDDKSKFNFISTQLCDMDTLNRIVSNSIDKQDMRLNDSANNVVRISKR